MSRPSRRPPRPLLRALLRAPVVLYRWRLGFLLGRSHLLLTHVGRRSGAVHETVVEVMHRDPRTGEVFVASYWGETSDWWRNISRTPARQVRVGRRSFAPEQRVVPLDERVDVVRRYRCSRRVWSWCGFRIFRLPSQRSEHAYRRAAAALPMVAFRPPAPDDDC